MTPCEGKTGAAMPGSQRERGAEPRLGPTLAAAFGPLANNGLAGALGCAAADGQARVSDGHVAHPVLVVFQVHQMLGEFFGRVAGEPTEALLELEFDRVDGAVRVFEVL